MDSLITILANRRSTRRYNVAKQGQIVVGDKRPAIPVSITDMSAFGARLRFDPAHFIPKEFDLLLGSGSLQFKASLRWREGEYAGVQFVDEPQHVAPSSTRSE